MNRRAYTLCAIVLLPIAACAGDKQSDSDAPLVNASPQDAGAGDDHSFPVRSADSSDVPRDAAAAKALEPLRVGVVLMNDDDNSIAYMNGFGGSPSPVALHVVNFGGVELSQGGWGVLANRIDRVKAANALPVIHVATVPGSYSKNGRDYAVENHWDTAKVKDYAEKLAGILNPRNVKWVVFGNEGKESNYFDNVSDVDEYVANFEIFESTIRPLVPGIKIYGPYTTGGVSQVQQERAWGQAIDKLGARMDGLAWDQAAGDYDESKWRHNSDWLDRKDPSGKMKIWLTEWYPGTPTDAAENVWQICNLATMPRYAMANMWAPNGAGMSGAILWNASKGGGAGKSASFETISKGVEFVQHPPISRSGDTFTNGLGKKIVINRSAKTATFL
jgi:hypothetical protein